MSDSFLPKFSDSPVNHHNSNHDTQRRNTRPHGTAP